MTPYSEKDEQIALLAKAMGHPARVAIIRLLLKKQTCICGDIVDELPLSQSTVSQHLKELKEAGSIEGEITGVKTCYCINGLWINTMCFHACRIYMGFACSHNS